MFGGYFNYADYRFAYTFPEIVAAGDFYNWSNGQRVLGPSEPFVAG